MDSDGDTLWDPGQEWIQIFDNLLKHPQECQHDIIEKTRQLSNVYFFYRVSKKDVTVTCAFKVHSLL